MMNRRKELRDKFKQERPDAPWDGYAHWLEAALIDLQVKNESSDRDEIKLDLIEADERRLMCIAARDLNRDYGCEALWSCSECPALPKHIDIKDVGDFYWDSSAIRETPKP